ncbi:MAG: RNA 2',3'-cyclic phosphodiesterase [Actinomycetaceae bacterium]|nr:RNA 2',3'-cyclic phosphodiesterase [Actinomycetaceae bacterium]
MGQRMFIALYPPQLVVDELTEFLHARPQMPWINPEQWHITLAFLASVPSARTDELIDRLRNSFARKNALSLQLCGAGVFPSPDRAKVLWMRPVALSGDLETLARTARNTANTCGATPDGRAFTAHLTVARLRRPIEATRWLRILNSFTSSSWQASHIRLIASYLGEGPSRRPRHEEVARFALHEE